MNDFDSQFKLMRRIFWIIFTVAAIGIVLTWILVGIGGCTLLTNPEGVGDWLGKILKGVKGA